MEPKGSDIAKSLAVQGGNPSNQLMQLQTHQRSNDIESTRKNSGWKAAGPNMQVTCKANAGFEVVSASGYPQEGTHFGAERCYLWMPTNHEHPLQSEGLRNLIWHASWHHHTSWVWAAEFVLLVQLADLQKQSSKKSNNTILNKVKNNYKMIQGCRWKLVTFVVKACFCWKIVGTPKM